MRKFGSEEWSGLVMVVLAIGVAIPTLFGGAATAIPRGWWIALFVVFIVTLVGASITERVSRRRYVAFAVAVAASWAVVLTAPAMGLLPVILVVTAAVSVYIVPLSAALLLVAANTAVVGLTTAHLSTSQSEILIVTGFYLLIQLATLLSSVTLIREQRLRRELTEAHIELQAAAVLLSESARTTERLRISRDLHDLIGHQLTVLTLELEAARHREGDLARAHVDKANQVARELLADVRETVGELRSEGPDLAVALQQLVRDLPGLDVAIEVDAGIRAGEAQTEALVRAAQEIVTNTVRHAGATALTIRVAATAGGIALTAHDDGCGTSTLVPGNGLRGLIERIEALGGGVNFDGSNGFTVTAQVPAS